MSVGIFSFLSLFPQASHCCPTVSIHFLPWQCTDSPVYTKVVEHGDHNFGGQTWHWVSEIEMKTVEEQHRNSSQPRPTHSFPFVLLKPKIDLHITFTLCLFLAVSSVPLCVTWSIPKSQEDATFQHSCLCQLAFPRSSWRCLYTQGAFWSICQKFKPSQWRFCSYKTATDDIMWKIL